MSDLILREQLLTSFQTLKSDFMASLVDAKKLDSEFQKAQKTFAVRMESHIRQAKKRLPEENPLSRQIDGILSAISDTDKAWQANLASYDKGLSFRQDFQDSLLVFVFGKVKSGKSSLGNYIAWGHTDPSENLKASVPVSLLPEYFTAANTNVVNGDADDEAKRRREFRVGATEATSSIQGFRLPGLTWVDSPGLHSVTDSNGKLAQEYVSHADLILYTMSSGSPGRASDLKEIRELKSKGKETLILLTGSDVNEEDWDDELGEPVSRVQMKSKETRQQQREYIAKELEGIDSNDILSNSARYAQEHLTDPKEMQNSGMVELFSRLHSISQNQGVQIKRAVPMTNFSNFLDKCRKELLPYTKLTNELDAQIAHLESSVPKVMARYTREAQKEMYAIIDDTFNTLENYRDDDEQMNKELRSARRSWDAKLQQIIGHALESGLAEISNELKHAADKTWYSASLELPNFSIEKVTEQISAGYQAGTKKRNSGWGGLGGLVAGGVAGFMLGGPAGAALGASLASGAGSMAGSAFGSDAKLKTKTIELNVGDNLESLKKEISDNYARVVKTVIEDESKKVLTNTLAEMRTVTRLVATELREVNERVEALKALSLQKIIKNGV
ncbi:MULTISPECIES: dynamin family protein [Shewanella]|uniref:dynamin family protein n=1 Tax=Shewanella TaxID=22 RepID=UPI0021DA51A7|nr:MULTISPECIES: dynamin family protein [Shewanella]MCU7997426.1 dynamin family protein [Shewanella sp. SM95]MCU8023479.1 dynamin family protein [Shewanella sp. SM78]MCU8028753.1 dynamin family protein [Shewanella sp. SM73]MCU8080516.1 dynamin family protein [Shewanella sp. SM103]